ncbi:MAG TPA: UDP-N-acetylmuramate dehydrogenase [Polyangiaceae bacterium]|nr:UDP-N-acetylmuramate dehydrogenase [Polyangiaceae bacterium]
MLSPRPRVRLAPLTTLGVGGDASFVVDGADDATVLEAFRWGREHGVAARVLGGGSNVVVGDGGFDGLVVRMLTRGRAFTPAGGELVLDAAAGEPWDELVAEAVARGAQGLECLSGIPGLAGATPIQNVGAYGQEVAETIASVRVLDRETLETEVFSAAACRFGYRDSFFKSDAPERYVVLGVSFRLRPNAPPSVRYAELAQSLASDGAEPTLERVRRAVLALRRGKSMLLDASDENGRSCGSFFVNPVVTRERAAAVELAAALPHDARMPRYPQANGSVKLAAGWLIERAGFAKGTRRGAVGLSTKHALALVAHDGAQAADVLGLAREIQGAVRAKFEVELTPEPVFWGI